MTCKVVTVSSVKGGVGKTTVSLSLAMAGAVGGLKVIAIDLDPTGGLTDATGSQAAEHTLSHALRVPGRAVNDAWPVSLRRPDGVLIRGTLRVLAADASLERAVVDGEALQAVVDQLRMAADVVIIDTPPRPLWIPGIVRVADRIVIPTTLDFNSVKGAARTAGIAFETGVLERVVGVVASNARRPLTVVARRLLAGLGEGLAFPTILWNSAEWVTITAGLGWVPRAEVFAIAQALLADVLGGFTCNPTMLDVLAHLIATPEGAD